MTERETIADHIRSGGVDYRVAPATRHQPNITVGDIAKMVESNMAILVDAIVTEQSDINVLETFKR